jgi:hypothetical protein
MWQKQQRNDTIIDFLVSAAQFCSGYAFPEAMMKGTLVDAHTKWLDNYVSLRNILTDQVITETEQIAEGS